jgi:hypothetical protein
MADLVCKPWFHGDVPTKTAENSLRLCKSGSFLVRFSNSKLDSYCISLVNQAKIIQHITIPYKCGEGVKIGSGVYETMCALVTGRKDKMNLQVACPGSPFAWLFEEDVAEVGGYGTAYA